MPTPTLTPEEAAAAPALSATPAPAALANPVLDDSNIKSMAAKFRENWQPKPGAPTTPNPDPSRMRPEPAAPVTRQVTLEPARPKAGEPVPAPETPAAAKPAEQPAKPETAPSPAPAEAAAPDPDIPPPEHAGPLSSKNWKKLHESRNNIRGLLERERKTREAAEARAQALEAETAKFKGLPLEPAKIAETLAERDRLAKEHDALIAQLETVNLERSPRFQSWWTSETGKHLKLAERAVPAAAREEVKRLLMEPFSTERDSRLAELTAELPEPTKRTLYSALEHLDSVKLQREEALTKGSEHWKQLQEAERLERVKADQAAAAARDRLTNSALTVAKSFSAFQPIAEDAAHNAEIPQREAFIRAAVSGQLDEDVAVSLPAAAVEYLHLANKVVPALRAELAKRDELIKQLQNASPAPGDGSAGGTREPEPEPGSAFVTAVRKAMGRR